MAEYARLHGPRISALVDTLKAVPTGSYRPVETVGKLDDHLTFRNVKISSIEHP